MDLTQDWMSWWPSTTTRVWSLKAHKSKTWCSTYASRSSRTIRISPPTRNRTELTSTRWATKSVISNRLSTIWAWSVQTNKRPLISLSKAYRKTASTCSTNRVRWIAANKTEATLRMTYPLAKRKKRRKTSSTTARMCYKARSTWSWRVVMMWSTWRESAKQTCLTPNTFKGSISVRPLKWSR